MSGVFNQIVSDLERKLIIRLLYKHIIRQRIKYHYIVIIAVASRIGKYYLSFAIQSTVLGLSTILYSYTLHACLSSLNGSF